MTCCFVRCEQHAPLELVAACSQEIQDSLILVTTRKGIQCPKHADYSDVARTIAYIVATSASSNKDVDPVLSLQVDLMCRRQRCAIHLARLLQGVNEHIITATTNETQPGLSDKEKKVAKQTSSLSDIKLPSIETLEPLVEAGLTMDILEAVALYCGIDKAGQLETIALEVENLNINRYKML
ncbi:hypothetical protein EON65_03550 [archaeon]|nr:MAG: hypothetical protein EON65_03550 [archaeon]